MSQLPVGLYELIKTEELEELLSGVQGNIQLEDLKPEAALRHLLHALTDQISDFMAEAASGFNNSEDKITAQVELLNNLMVYARNLVNSNAVINAVSQPLQILRSISTSQQKMMTPAIGLAQPWLFTSGKDSPALLHELQSEIASCNSVDILVSFITVSGVRKIIDTLRTITALDAQGRSQTKIRIITTTYVGATDQKAVDLLASLPNTQVKISLDGRRTRLHAKAWIFERETGFGSAYVGSANLSGAALMGGLEWTVKFTEKGQGALFSRARAHFETLWQDDEFQIYDPHDLDHRQALKAALVREKGGHNGNVEGISNFFDINPKPFQRIILDQLENERAQGRFKSLLVAATGTGKTVMAAFDYKRLCAREGGQPRLLFVAHRKEILQQALNTYRQVLRDGNFGELLTGQHDPAQYSHVFSTVQSALSRNLVKQFGADHWRVVVIDECHHMAANSFVQFVTDIEPKYLLGLTATPERQDNKNIFLYFDMRPDGSPAAQLRLWHALDQQLLAPFEYYAIDDGMDYRNIPWQQSNEVSVLDSVLTGNRVRAQAIVSAWLGLVSDIVSCRALAFCVSIRHAQFMTEMFNRAGIKAALITGEATSTERQELPRKLDRREINVLVTVDLYNEGIDLPFVDTLLLLRPTQSSTLFQQQIGRGLRLHEGKESCLVLDFVGITSGDFRYDILYSAITGLTRKEIVTGVEKGFGRLPLGCHIQLQKKARDYILESLKQAVNFSWKRLAQELVHYRQRTGSLSLNQFLHDQQLEITDIYRATTGSTNTGWTTLKREALLLNSSKNAAALYDEKYYSRRFGALLHIDDIDQIEFIRKVALDHKLSVQDSEEQTRLLMLCYQISGGKGVVRTSKIQGLLSASPDLREELLELCNYLAARSVKLYCSLPGFSGTPLKLHSAYQVREILSAIGHYTQQSAPPFQAGVLKLKEQNIECLFVTLDKSDAIHEGVAYDDYAISRSLFHWQSQSATRPNTPNGQRYIQQALNGWQFQLFVRLNKQCPYRACGPVEFVSFNGSRPMNITWKLKEPLTDELFQSFSVIRG